MLAITNTRLLRKFAAGLGSILTGLVLLKLAAHFDTYTLPLMTVREMWYSLPAALKIALASGYLLILCGCVVLMISFAKLFQSKPA